MSHWMFNCREVTRLVSESLDRKMTLGERIGIKMHLWMCKLCPEVMKQMLFIRESMQLISIQEDPLSAEVSLSPEARERITRALAQG